MSNCYFSHDSNARNSKKMLRLRKAHGAEGYGTYFMLLERLREEGDFHCDADYEMLSYDLRVPADVIESVVTNFGLFEFNEDRTRFFSTGFNERMDIKDKRSAAGAKGAEARWGARAENPAGMAQNGKIMANAMAKDVCHDFANGSSSDKEKESKEKEKESKDYYSSSQTPLPSSEAEEELLEEQQQEIIVSFVERNYRKPVTEYRNMVNYNRTGGRDWDKMSFKQRRATAQLWKQMPEEPRRFPPALLPLWSSMYRQARSLGADNKTIAALLSDSLDISIRDGTLTLACDTALYDFIEVRYLDHFKQVLQPFMESNKLVKLNYRILNGKV